MTSERFTVPVRFHLLLPEQQPIPVAVEMQYDQTDPYAVMVSFKTGGDSQSETVSWTFARDLLADGMKGPVGEGDVQVSPAAGMAPQTVPGSVLLVLSSPSGRADFQVDRVGLETFLGMSYGAVPRGDEGLHSGLDDEIELLFLTR